MSKRTGPVDCCPLCESWSDCECPLPVAPDPDCPECAGKGQVVIDEVDIGVGVQERWGACSCVYPKDLGPDEEERTE